MIQNIVRNHYLKWIEVNQFKLPTLTDCLDFMVCEATEAIDKRLRRDSYVRNNSEGCPSDMDIAIEVFDTIMMGCIALDLLNYDLENIAEMKLKMMDKKRGIK